MLGPPHLFLVLHGVLATGQAEGLAAMRSLQVQISPSAERQRSNFLQTQPGEVAQQLQLRIVGTINLLSGSAVYGRKLSGATQSET